MERINKLKKLKPYVTFFEGGGWMGNHVYVTVGYSICYALVWFQVVPWLKAYFLNSLGQSVVTCGEGNGRRLKFSSSSRILKTIHRAFDIAVRQPSNLK